MRFSGLVSTLKKLLVCYRPWLKGCRRKRKERKNKLCRRGEGGGDKVFFFSLPFFLSPFLSFSPPCQIRSVSRTQGKARLPGTARRGLFLAHSLHYKIRPPPFPSPLDKSAFRTGKLLAMSQTLSQLLNSGSTSRWERLSSFIYRKLFSCVI